MNILINEQLNKVKTLAINQITYRDKDEKKHFLDILKKGFNGEDETFLVNDKKIEKDEYVLYCDNDNKNYYESLKNRVFKGELNNIILELKRSENFEKKMDSHVFKLHEHVEKLIIIKNKIIKNNQLLTDKETKINTLLELAEYSKKPTVVILEDLFSENNNLLKNLQKIEKLIYEKRCFVFLIENRTKNLNTLVNYLKIQ